MKKKTKIDTPKGYSVESIEKIGEKIVVLFDKDKKLKNGAVAKIVPIRVVIGL